MKTIRRDKSRPSHVVRSNILSGRSRNGRINSSTQSANQASSNSLSSSGPRPSFKLNTLSTCLIKQQCGACAFVNTDYEDSLNTKFETGLKLLSAAGLTVGAQILRPLASPRQLGYRTLFKVAVRPGEGEKKFAIGLFQPGTHKIGPDLSSCPIHAAPLARLLRDLNENLEQSTLTPYKEDDASGDLRYIVARAAHLTGELMVTFVVTHALKVELQRLVSRLKAAGHKIHAAYMNINNGVGNAIFGDETIHLYGSLGLRERLCDLDFEVGPTAFFQVNPWQASNLYRRVEQIAGTVGPNQKKVAWDLYCGIGQMALMLARSGYKTLGIEENSEAVQSAAQNAKRNRITNADFIAAKVEDSETLFPNWAQSPAVIVVNPSRRGLHDRARSHLSHILRTHPQAKFIYVSCEVETLTRDLQSLVSAGFQVRQIEAFDMFAQTDNLEWLTVLTAKSEIK